MTVVGDAEIASSKTPRNDAGGDAEIASSKTPRNDGGGGVTGFRGNRVCGEFWGVAAAAGQEFGQLGGVEALGFAEGVGVAEGARGVLDFLELEVGVEGGWRRR